MLGKIMKDLHYGGSIYEKSYDNTKRNMQICKPFKRKNEKAALTIKKSPSLTIYILSLWKIQRENQ